MAFDPFHKWLGIPPHEQPPDHYRLLGISCFESDADVIDAAANRQMSYVQGFANGEHAKLSQILLNQLAAARLSLLNPESKRSYDAQLEGLKSRKSEPKPTDGATRKSPKPPKPEVAPQTLPVRNGRKPSHSPQSSASSDPVPAVDLGRRIDLDPDKTHRGFRWGWIVGGIALFAIPILGTIVRPKTSEERSQAALVPIPAVSRLPEVKLAKISQAIRPPAPLPGPTTFKPVWNSPTIRTDSESLFTSLFQDRTIEGAIHDMSNCWISEKFEDFVLRFDYRLRRHESRPWNGVRLRHGTGHRLSVILTEGSSGGLLLETPTGEIPPPLVVEVLDSTHRIVKPIRSTERPFGEWNRCEVVCLGTRTTVWINDEAVNDIPKGPKGSGMICLMGFEQDLGFRNLRVLSLDHPPRAAVVQSTPPKQWSEQKRGNSPKIPSVIPGVIQVNANTHNNLLGDYAEFSGKVARIGMGGNIDFGIGEIGLEFEGLQSIKIGVRKNGTVTVHERL